MDGDELLKTKRDLLGDLEIVGDAIPVVTEAEPTVVIGRGFPK